MPRRWSTPGCAQGPGGPRTFEKTAARKPTESRRARKKQKCKFNKKAVVMELSGLPPIDKNKNVRWMGHSFILRGSATPVRN